MSAQDFLPDFSHVALGEAEGPTLRAGEPGLTCTYVVGVAGFEPTASSSRSRKGNACYLLTCLYLLVKPLVLVSLRELRGVLITRSTPHSPPKIARSHLLVRASRRAGTARPGQSGCLRCAAGSPRTEAGIPERPGPGRAALAAGGNGYSVGGLRANLRRWHGTGFGRIDPAHPHPSCRCTRSETPTTPDRPGSATAQFGRASPHGRGR